jgi:hypothetical protein
MFYIRGPIAQRMRDRILFSNLSAIVAGSLLAVLAARTAWRLYETSPFFPVTVIEGVSLVAVILLLAMHKPAKEQIGFLKIVLLSVLALAVLVVVAFACIVAYSTRSIGGTFYLALACGVLTVRLLFLANAKPGEN